MTMIGFSARCSESGTAGLKYRSVTLFLANSDCQAYLTTVAPKEIHTLLGNLR